MIAVGGGRKAAFAAGACSAVLAHPVAKMRILADEAAAGRLRVVPLVPPDAFDQEAHGSFPLPQLFPCGERFSERKRRKAAMRGRRRWIRRRRHDMRRAPRY